MAETVKIVDLDIDEKELLKKLTKLQQEITDLKVDTKELNDANKQLEKDGKKNTQQYKDNSKQIEVNKISTKGLSTEYRDNQKVLINLNTTESNQLGTLQKLELSNKKLREEGKKLDLTRKSGQDRLKVINKQLDQNNKTILKNSDALKKQKMNVGAYGSALGGLGGPLAGATRGVEMLNAAFKFLILNPIGLILIAIAAAVKTMGDAVKRNQPAMDELKATVSGLKVVYGNWLDFQNELYATTKKLTFKELIQRFKDLGKEMKEDYKTAKLLTLVASELYRQETKDVVLIAKLTQTIEAKRLASKDANITEQERFILLKDAMKKEEELLNVRVLAAAKRELIAIEEGKLNVNIDEEDRAIAEATANRINVKTAAYKRMRTLASELKTVEIKAAKEVMEVREREALVAAKAVDNEIQLERIKSITINEIKDDDVEKEIARSQTLKVVNQKVAEVDIELAKLVGESKLDIAQSYLKGIVGLFGAQSKIGKAAAVAETAINTYRGAQAAYAALSGIPVVGPGLGIAAAGAAVLMGLANVKKILAVKTPGGGGGGGGGGGRPSISTGNIPGSIPKNYTARPADGGIITQGIINSTAAAVKQGVSEALKESPPVLVIEDVTSKQMQQDSVSKVTTV